MKKYSLALCALLLALALAIPALATISGNPMDWTWGSGGRVHIVTRDVTSNWTTILVLFQGKEIWQGRGTYPKPNILIRNRISPTHTQWEFLLPYKEVVEEDRYEANVAFLSEEDAEEVFRLANGNLATQEAMDYIDTHAFWGNTDLIRVSAPIAKTNGPEGGRIVFQTRFWDMTSWNYQEW